MKPKLQHDPHPHRIATCQLCIQLQKKKRKPKNQPMVESGDVTILTRPRKDKDREFICDGIDY